MERMKNVYILEIENIFEKKLNIKGAVNVKECSK